MISRTDSDAPHITGKGAPADKNNGLPRALFLLVELGFFLGLNCVRHQDSFISRLSLQVFGIGSAVRPAWLPE
jgi:hypothetical protein